MAKDRYLFIRDNVTGFSFSNLGLFTGFGDGVYNAVYSLVILSIFTGIVGASMASAVVGVYVGIYSVFCMFISLFSNQLLRWFPKAKLLYMAMLFVAICYAMMSLSIKPTTFIALDYTSGIGSTMVGILIPLFMADFAEKSGGMARLNARYHLWANVGAVAAPLVATAIMTRFGDNRLPFMASALVYFAGLMFFKNFGIIQQDKKISVVSPKRTLRGLWLNALAFFRYENMGRAYFVNFGYYALRSLRLLYVPIMVIERGFSAETLGWVLTIGILPYIILDLFIGKLVKKFGSKMFMTIGLVSFAVLAGCATFATGNWLLVIFVLWQISGACMEPVHDLMFFDNTKKTEQSRFYGIFRTSVNFPSVITPIVGGLVIASFGATAAVWYVCVGIGLFTAAVLWAPKH